MFLVNQYGLLLSHTLDGLSCLYFNLAFIWVLTFKGGFFAMRLKFAHLAYVLTK